jgi:hypothetical protein
MHIAAEILKKAGTDVDRRKSDRELVQMRAGFRKRGYDRAKADIRDLSATGFQIDTSMILHESGDVWLKLPALAPKHAVVKWVNDFRAGCEFSAPLHDAVLARILARGQAG